MMTRKDYRLIAAALLEAREAAVGSELSGIEFATRKIAKALETNGGNDLNGNRRFKMDVFLKAAGVSA